MSLKKSKTLKSGFNFPLRRKDYATAQRDKESWEVLFVFLAVPLRLCVNKKLSSEQNPEVCDATKA